MVLFRRQLGDVLRGERMRRGMTLRELSSEARISLGYISEIERGQKEASSELLSSLCEALDVPLSAILREVSDTVAGEEQRLAAEAAVERLDIHNRRRDEQGSDHLPIRARPFERVPPCDSMAAETVRYQNDRAIGVRHRLVQLVDPGVAVGTIPHAELHFAAIFALVFPDALPVPPAAVTEAWDREQQWIPALPINFWMGHDTLLDGREHGTGVVARAPAQASLHSLLNQ